MDYHLNMFTLRQRNANILIGRIAGLQRLFIVFIAIAE